MATATVGEVVSGKAEQKPSFKMTTATDALNRSIDREEIGQVLLRSIDWDAAITRHSDRSGDDYKTTQNISWNMTDESENRYQVSVSVNRWPKKQAREGVSGKAGKDQIFKLAGPEMQFIESQLAEATNAGNNTLAGKLMTLKITNQVQGGVSLDQVKFLGNLVEEFGRKQAEKDAVVS